ncbi:hypothetical protein [Methylorubrum extorquens]|jgi:hypothetical protein|uniref:hypothetical protein n=1 Tax=Methylorubrum extorquens TaxID=408 RepID=UPI00209CC755|nr:hypothetical protein [Methylorubrum extorquens]MDF9864540.1 hypothetical protein [Methylorubrum pseudosasae]MDH6638129.1 hypothetical protein [Methylobacterium sp. SuP10 SLI 274]MDH6667310.1 hypothetical protein [Methylorubrum zatmanii]MCP1537642.1 hypothetical protein [Methylorubrum extorquens]MCP1559212.1 hypothetical protein [Methylorubrum extorquens]
MSRPLAVALLALSLYLGVLDCALSLSFSMVHAWLLDLVGRTGLWLVIAATLFGGTWVVWSEQEDG